MKSRLPNPSDVLQVYAVIAVMFAAWTITAFLWKLSAWLLLLNLGEIFTLFSYAMTANFIESLIVLLLLLTGAALLPADTLRDDFAVRGTILSLGLIGSLIAFVGSEMRFGFENGPRLLLPPLFILGLTLVALRFGVMRSMAAWLSDRMTVFLFILLPLFVTLSAYVIFRNIA